MKLIYSIFFLLIANLASIGQETRTLSSFEQVSAATGIKVTLVMAQEYSARIEIEGGTPDEVLTEVKGNRLYVKFAHQDGWNRNKNRNAHVTVQHKGLNGVSVSSGAQLLSENKLRSESMVLEASSGGTMTIEVESGDLQADASSGGVIKISGGTRTLNLDVSSGGVIKGPELSADEAVADASSGGSASFMVKNSLTADASSGGSIRYGGKPAKIKSHSSSAGSIKEVL